MESENLNKSCMYCLAMFLAARSGLSKVSSLLISHYFTSALRVTHHGTLTQAFVKHSNKMSICRNYK